MLFISSGDPPSNEAAKGPYPTVVDNPSGAKTLVVQDYTWGKYLGELNVVFNDNGEVESHSGNPILLDNSVPEGEIYMYSKTCLKQPLKRRPTFGF